MTQQPVQNQQTSQGNRGPRTGGPNNRRKNPRARRGRGNFQPNNNGAGTTGGKINGGGNNGGNSGNNGGNSGGNSGGYTSGNTGGYTSGNSGGNSGGYSGGYTGKPSNSGTGTTGGKPMNSQGQSKQN